MNAQVNALTVSAGPFFKDSRLLVPDFQRRYSWEPDSQLLDFWRDLSAVVGGGEHFLGLVILADCQDSEENAPRHSRREIVDGQQRLVTTTILANALRLIALELGRRLVAESLRTDFLYSIDFETEEQMPRLQLTDPEDAGALSSLLEAVAADDLSGVGNSRIGAAHHFLYEKLHSDVTEHNNPALRVGQWTEFISNRLNFAIFIHPDREAAFKVFEVINTRGKNLTPAELIKSYLIGNSSPEDREQTHKRWAEIGDQIAAVGASDQLTTFVRHVVTLKHGYVTPSELYQVVAKNYKDAAGVGVLLEALEAYLPTYIQMLDPASDIESSEIRSRAFALVAAMSMARFRPIFLAASSKSSSKADELYLQLLNILIPGVLVGAFSSGNIEAQFARAARNLMDGLSWDSELQRLRELRPPASEFSIRMLRNMNKAQAHVVRSAYLQSSGCPRLDGYAHQVRPRNGEGWTDFDQLQFSESGGYIGNWVLTSDERRPQRTNTPDTVIEKILPALLKGEKLPENELRKWTAKHVQDLTEETIRRVEKLWYESDRG